MRIELVSSVSIALSAFSTFSGSIKLPTWGLGVQRRICISTSPEVTRNSSIPVISVVHAEVINRRCLSGNIGMHGASRAQPLHTSLSQKTRK